MQKRSSARRVGHAVRQASARGRPLHSVPIEPSCVQRRGPAPETATNSYQEMRCTGLGCSKPTYSEIKPRQSNRICPQCTSLRPQIEASTPLEPPASSYPLTGRLPIAPSVLLTHRRHRRLRLRTRRRRIRLCRSVLIVDHHLQPLVRRKARAGGDKAAYDARSP
jgi:hypothetical protein